MLFGRLSNVKLRRQIDSPRLSSLIQRTMSALPPCPGMTEVQVGSHKQGYGEFEGFGISNFERLRRMLTTQKGSFSGGVGAGCNVDRAFECARSRLH